MNPKRLQYLMGHSDISVTMNVYTNIGFDDAEEELKRMEEFRKAQVEIEKKNENRCRGRWVTLWLDGWGVIFVWKKRKIANIIK